MDIVIPHTHEDDFAVIAERLGTKELLFLYTLQTFKQGKNTGIICLSQELKNAKKKTPVVFVKAQGDVRKLIEQKPHAIYGFEYIENKDSFHQRRSGMDHICAKLMAENSVAYVFSFNDLLNALQHMQPIILGRLYQNLMLAKKYNVQVILASFAEEPFMMRNEKDMMCLRI